MADPQPVLVLWRVTLSWPAPYLGRGSYWAVNDRTYVDAYAEWQCAMPLLHGWSRGLYRLELAQGPDVVDLRSEPPSNRMPDRRISELAAAGHQWALGRASVHPSTGLPIDVAIRLIAAPAPAQRVATTTTGTWT